MERTIRFAVCVLVATSSLLPVTTSISLQSYTLYKELEQSLINGNTSSVPNLVILEDSFFPKQRTNPLCLPVKYTIACNNKTLYDEFDELNLVEELLIPCFSPEYNSSYLWTETYLSSVITTMLYAYAHSGITLKGFAWENSCALASQVEILLELNFNYSKEAVDSTLNELTSQLKAYAEARGIPKVSSAYKGYSLGWNSGHVHFANTIFTVHIILLNVFIFFFSLASSNRLYNGLYDNIKQKKKPGYPLFWAIVFLSVLWNVFPSWVILSELDTSIYISFGIMIPLQLLVALVLKKKATFPIPLFPITASLKKKTNTHSLSKDIFSSCLFFMNHLIQVISIWSLLVTFTFIMHYFMSVAISFYLDPVNSLVKIVFIKTVVICFIINVALLLTIDNVDLRCKGEKPFQTNLYTVISIVTIFSITPLLIILAFMLGGIIFSSPWNNWNILLTMIPSGLVLFVSWYSQGLLGFTDGKNPTKEIIKDLEGNTKPHSIPPAEEAGRDKVLVTNDATPLLLQQTSSIRPRVVYTSSDHTTDP